MSTTALPAKRVLRVLANESVAPTAWLLSLERADFDFTAGELISLRGEGEQAARDYTLVSGTDDPTLDVIYRLVPHGVLTPQLVEWQPGDEVEVTGPYGTFVVRDVSRPLLFLATGTGIAPARTFLRSHPGLDLTVVHGVREPVDLFFRDEFETMPGRYVPCVSGDTANAPAGHFPGRLTRWLEQELATFAEHDIYLCGANEMIYEVTDFLREKSVPDDQVFTEPYYYRADD